MDRECLLRESLEKPVPPYSIRDDLTFYCPQENEDAFNHRDIVDYHQFLEKYLPPVDQRYRNMLLLLPCTKTKPYSLSIEHYTVNSFLLKAGFQPTGSPDYPKEMERFLPNYIKDLGALNNSLLLNGDVLLHRMVVSEPLGLVPYEYIYRFRGDLSIAGRYDDPGLFEHRGNTVCPWRSDCTGVFKNGRWIWGKNEWAAYARVHNRLSDLIYRVLKQISQSYVRILAYVSPALTHYSFLTNGKEKDLLGLRSRIEVEGLTIPLKGVHDYDEGLVVMVLDHNTLKELVAIDDTIMRDEVKPLTMSQSLNRLLQMLLD